MGTLTADHRQEHLEKRTKLEHYIKSLIHRNIF